MRATLAVLVVIAAGGEAIAGVSAWQLTEVERKGPGGDAEIRFVELHADLAGCWYPSTQVAVYDAAGAAIGAVAPFASTTCFGDDSYVLLATTGAEATYGVTATSNQVPTFPANARQLCLRSTGTIYDCVRWGAVTGPVHDLFGPDDDTAAATPPSGVALARTGDTDVIADDWVLAEPTPGAANDGAVVTPPDPDAGVPDAGPIDPPDAGPPPDANVDARPAPDARDDRFLDLDPVGGAGCGCQGGGGASSGWLALGLGLAWARPRRVRRARRPGACRRTATPP